MIITILGRPIPAVRMTQKTKWNKASKRYLAYKDSIGIMARRVYPIPTNENVSVKVRVYLSGKTTPMGGEGDVDNYAKSALDGCNKVAFKDDRQVMELSVSKEPCKELDQRMEIEIREMKPKTCETCARNQELKISDECAACVNKSEWKEVEG